MDKHGDITIYSIDELIVERNALKTELALTRNQLASSRKDWDAQFDEISKLKAEVEHLKAENAELKEITDNCCKHAIAEANRLRKALKKITHCRVIVRDAYATLLEAIVIADEALKEGE